MLEEIFRAIQDGATLMTGSRRLARVLSRDFHARQREQGRSVWEHPDILPFDAFLDRAWREWLVRASGDTPVLLNSVQEQVVWEQVMRESPEGESLLRIPETAREAMEAWRLIQAYRLPLDGRFEATEDWAAYADWSRRFKRRLEANGWLERARLSDFLRGGIAPGGTFFLAGFDDLTPQQVEFLNALGKVQRLEPPAYRSTQERRRVRDSMGEIRAAAHWARRQIEQNPEARIGIIVPDLARRRPAVERIFQEGLDPGGEQGDQKRCFHVSLGPPLGDYPLVRAALLALEFGLGSMSLPQTGLLLRSPFLGGAESEWTGRAVLDAKLRRRGRWDIPIDALCEAAASCAQLQRVLGRFERELQDLPNAQRAGDWSRDFARLLEALGWPGDRPLSSREFQTREAWHGMLSQFAALDLATPLLSYGQALGRLQELASTTIFQVENEGAPVQVMGLLEASGLRFDHLWIMGLHDDALPAPPSPNPFLPISLQREFGLPHSSAGRELEFSTKLLGRLLASAPDVVVSYPEMEGDRALAPSPLVAGGLWLLEKEQPPRTGWIARMRAAASLEQLADETAPPIAGESEQSGGVRLFRDMAACPFRAFAVHRLGAKPLEDGDLGLSYRDRGATVHKALESIWAELGSQARLMALSAEELQGLIRRSIDQAVDTLGPGIGRNLERRRLERLLSEWLQVEKSRAGFRIYQSEKDRAVSVGGLQIRVRADRIDELPDGRQIVLDYKTGKVSPSAWMGDRLDEPQVPLYCATSELPVAGAAFAQIRTGESGFLGLTEPGVSLPGMKAMRLEQAAPFYQQVAGWRSVLERLALDFRAGKAAVDPKRGACDHCGLRALCRIREFENDRG